MIKMFKKLWDLFGGIGVGILMAFLAKFKLYNIQVSYSVIILILVNIGLFRVIRQYVDKKEKKNRHTLIDTIVDGQKAIQAISIAQNPIGYGEVRGKLIIKFLEELRNIMKKIKELFEKFKGIVLAIALGILTVIEMYGGYINALCGGKLVFKGVELLPYITLVASLVVGIISNGWTKEQREKIKALFSKSTTDELIHAEIKNTLKTKEAKLKQFKHILTTKESEKANLESELVTLENAYKAKQEMFCMLPQLATEEDVQLAHNAVVEIKEKIYTKTSEIDGVNETISKLTTEINALKSQL